VLPIADTELTRDGKILILAYDHGLEHGPTDFTDHPERMDPQTVFDAATHDAVTSIGVQKGLAEGYYPSYEDDVSLLVKLNGTSNLWRGEPDSAVNCTVDYAADIGADAVGFTLYGGSNSEIEMAEEFRDAQESARAHGLPMVAWSYPRGQGLRNAEDSNTIAYAARETLELGADVAKVKYPGSREAMEHTVRATGGADGMKVVVSGGSKVSDEVFLQEVKGVMDAGGAGLAVGRNVWQREDPTQLLDALEDIIYEGASVDAALS
jgi:class I fructose-bisphosphate aldolase